MKSIVSCAVCIVALVVSAVSIAACADENLPAPRDPASATVNEPLQCAKDTDCKDGQRCVVGSCTAAK